MTTILVLGQDQTALMVAKQLASSSTVKVHLMVAESNGVPDNLPDQITIFQGDLTQPESYERVLDGVGYLYSGLEGSGVDLALEAVFDELRIRRQALTRTVMLTTLGVDQELTSPMAYPGILDVSGYLNEQRFAAKVIDEAEFPYTLLRAGELVDGPAERPRLISEGTPVQPTPVSRETIATLATQILLGGGYDYQSLGVIQA
ncbi:NAD(P)H-binding protein [Levilactobacillus bambusae]|uniref:Saccharopine dehydrogenase n=1 Tax=Levilactobacillus bambusae TaxID=2024736 RepID=A0A2V1N326_9LACO|nr:NAD(P)H-binding protein [Levilactobacillus bambusae]PWG00556.1 saccharopine dehydrogenase [Levilactobacillus bambusae]